MVRTFTHLGMLLKIASIISHNSPSQKKLQKLFANAIKNLTRGLLRKLLRREQESACGRQLNLQKQKRRHNLLLKILICLWVKKIAAAHKAMKKADSKKKEKVYLVSNKNNGVGKTKPRFHGGSKVKVVDPRMKKDIRAAKKREKTVGRSKGGKGRK